MSWLERISWQITLINVGPGKKSIYIWSIFNKLSYGPCCCYPRLGCVWLHSLPVCFAGLYWDVWQWLRLCLAQVEIKATTDTGSAAPSVKSYWLYMYLFISQCRYSWMLEYFAWDLTVFISEYSEQSEFLKTSFYFSTVFSFPLRKQMTFLSSFAYFLQWKGLSSSFRVNITCVRYLMGFLMNCGC